MYTLSTKMLTEYLNEPIDDEDIKVIRALIENEIYILLNALSE